MILSVSFFLRSIGQNNAVKRILLSTRALWLAEAGVAEAVRLLPTAGLHAGTLGGDNFHYSATTTLVSYDPDADESIFRVVSTGTVSFGSASSLSRNVEAYVRLSPPNPGDFTAAIESEGELRIRGNPSITGLTLENSDFSFEGKFNLTPEEVRRLAIHEGTYYENPGRPIPNFGTIDPDAPQITWVKITDPRQKLTIPRTGWEGSGILVVEGETEIEGGEFNGVIWVIGELKISGNPQITGTVLAESGTEVTDVTGTPELTYSLDEVDDALDLLRTHARRTIISWRETS
jgi:hypothetical protein